MYGSSSTMGPSLRSVAFSFTCESADGVRFLASRSFVPAWREKAKLFIWILCDDLFNESDCHIICELSRYQTWHSDRSVFLATWSVRYHSLIVEAAELPELLKHTQEISRSNAAGIYGSRLPVSVSNGFEAYRSLCFPPFMHVAELKRSYCHSLVQFVGRRNWTWLQQARHDYDIMVDVSSLLPAWRVRLVCWTIC